MATVAHTPTESNFCASIIANKTFDLARSEHLKMEGFPNFKKAVQDLKNVEPPPQPEYSVCIALHDALVIKEATIDQWMDKSDFQHEMSTLLKTHNDEFNKKGLKRGSQANQSDADSRPAKRLCVESDPLPLDKFETDHPDRPAQLLCYKFFLDSIESFNHLIVVVKFSRTCSRQPPPNQPSTNGSLMFERKNNRLQIQRIE